MTSIPLADDEDRAALRKLARDVAERDIAPYAAGWDETEEFAEASLAALRRAELFTVTVGEDYGGMGMGDVEAAIVLEEIARADVSSAILCQLVFNGPPRAIEHLGNEAMRRPVAAPGRGRASSSASASPSPTPARRPRPCVPTWSPTANGWRLEAYKNFVTGGHKSVACLVWCRFPGSEPGTGKGIGAVLVDLSKPEVSVAGTHKKMGLRGCTEAELAFDGVRIEPDDVLVAGDPADNSGLKTLLAHINHERCGNAAMCVGAAQGALEYAMGYMRDRKVGTKSLADLQGLQWKIADMATELEGARLLLQRAVSLAGPHGTPAAPGVGHGQGRLQPGGQAGLRRGHPTARRLRLQPGVRRRARVSGHPGPVHRGRDRRDPAQLHRHRAPRRDQARPGDGWKTPRTMTPTSRPRAPVVAGGAPVAVLGVGVAAPGCGSPPRTWPRPGAPGAASTPSPSATPTRTRSRWPGRPRSTRWPRPESMPRSCLGPVVGHHPPAVRRGPEPRLPVHALWAWPIAAGGRAERGLAARRDRGAARRLGCGGRRPRASWRWSWPPTRWCPGVGTAGEATTGAGAVALVLGAADRRGANGAGPAGAPGGPVPTPTPGGRRPLPRRRPGRHRRRLRRPALS